MDNYRWHTCSELKIPESWHTYLYLYVKFLTEAYVTYKFTNVCQPVLLVTYNFIIVCQFAVWWHTIIFSPPNPSLGRWWAADLWTRLLYIVCSSFWTVVCGRVNAWCVHLVWRDDEEIRGEIVCQKHERNINDIHIQNCMSIRFLMTYNFIAKINVCHKILHRVCLTYI